MFTSTRIATLMIVAGAQLVAADMSLYIPGFDPQPLSVSIIGAGSDGRTTYQVVPGAQTGAWASEDIGFVGTGKPIAPHQTLHPPHRSNLVLISFESPRTGTLVEGSDYASFRADEPELSLTLVEACHFAGGSATCTAAIPGQTTIVEVEAASPFLVQGNAAVATPTGSSGSGSGSGSSDSNGSNGATPGSGTASGAKPTSTANAAVGSAVVGASSVLIGAAAGLFAMAML
ncbi:hypothetical protein CONPUDRAFT_149596 [Coniophora puteana RWD-64-598 SS2]|uniref:GPI anchored protein n=1 Tax=Coniophora puteana (strain RWD-64-598) TaxID=741705 RepID=A0A5M3N0F8_CONPW|nr:uncharacterized protein CONPUDRAFT_149596 [Coniophora puteana RWD-64-598 SS2]EIW84727.1 hypothetical protein CONPUDRAFT_149596 [Coniophora puteana RWD-64-598 SS2]